MKDTTTPEATSPNREQRISALAYQIWEEEGRPEGRAEVHWYLACQMIDAEEEAEEPLPAWLNKQEPETKPALVASQPETKKKSAA